jgi:hypothetical protein
LLQYDDGLPAAADPVAQRLCVISSRMRPTLAYPELKSPIVLVGGHRRSNPPRHCQESRASHEKSAATAELKRHGRCTGQFGPRRLGKSLDGLKIAWLDVAGAIGPI